MNKSVISPLFRLVDLEVFIHYVMTGEVAPRCNAPSVREATNKLLRMGLVVCNDGGYSITARGDKFAEMLLATPLPVQEWKDPR